MKNIATLTINPAIDKSTSIEHVVADRKLRCSPPGHYPGGGGINVSRALKNLGAPSAAVYPAGGPTGEMLKGLLDREGIDHRPVAIEGWTRENLTVIEETSGRQYRFGMPGPKLSQAEWKSCLDALVGLEPRPDYLIASGSLPPGVSDSFYAEAAEMSGCVGCSYIVDTSGTALRHALGVGAFLIKCNIRELGELAGEEIHDDARIEVVAGDYISAGKCHAFVVSLGAGGAMLVSKEGATHYRAPTVPIMSRIGAGDSMVAGIVISLARGEGLVDAVRFGVASGAAAVMSPGTELCKKEDTERLYALMAGGDG